MNSQKITAMRAGGKILASILKDLKNHVEPGMNELDIDKWVEQEIKKRGATVAYHEKSVNFPGSICISVNDEFIHGAPEDNILERGDVVKFDLSIGYQDYYTDSAFTMVVGEEPRGAIKHLLNFTEAALYAGIAEVKNGAYLGTVGHAIEKTLEKGKLGIVRNYTGHGIGASMHEDPEVLNYGKKNTGYILKTGDAICIEPMASLGKPASHVSETDGWTVSFNDGSIGAHFEHTILVTDDGYEILTAWDE